MSKLRIDGNSWHCCCGCSYVAGNPEATTRGWFEHIRVCRLGAALHKSAKVQSLVIRQLIVDELGNRGVVKAICNR